MFTVSAQASTTTGESSVFSPTTNATWTNVIVLARMTDGASSQGTQTLTINITDLPNGGANYRVYKTTANGGDYMADPKPLVLGVNTITIAAVAFDRGVKVQVSSPEIGFDTLYVNGSQLYPAVAVDPVDPDDVISIGDSPAFADTTNATWIKVISLTNVNQGASSQATQILSMNITELPENGASYRVYKTTSNGQINVGNGLPLTLGNNTITVPSVVFDRTVKIQFSSSDIKFDSLSVNGGQLHPVDLNAGYSVGESSVFTPVEDNNEGWTDSIALTSVSDGAVSHSAQILSINILALPDGGASYRIYKTTLNGYDDFANPVALTLGTNIVTVTEVEFDRNVSVQVSSSDIRFDHISINGSELDLEATDPVDPAEQAAGITLNEYSAFYDKDHATWVKVIDLALVADGASSQDAQTLSINVTELPEGGANYRVYKTTANGNDFFGDAQELVLGNNIVTVAGVDFDRSVKVQFSSSDIRFDALSVNADQLYPEVTDPVDPQPGITVGESSSFAPTTNASWTRVINLTLTNDGASSQAEQTLSINVTELPEGGASYRVYKTTANGSDFFSSAQDLVLGDNIITVAAVAFDRAVKVQLSSVDVRFDALSINETQIYPEPERIDSDNDGIFDDEDAFPDDPAESVDTDNDGIGNNSDTDDDGDGVEDSLDGDPLDPNVGELPKQMISVLGNPSAMPGKATSVTVSYNASDNDETLTGLGLKVHYNSSVLTFVEFAEVFAADNIGASGPFEDTDDTDNDPSTDKYLSASWASLFGDWPGQLPKSLLTINFNTAEEVSAESTTIRFSSVSTAASHGFAPEAYDMSISEGSWDFDKDGNADALTDGLLLLRYTFGLRGASLTDGAIASDSSLTLEEVEANVADSTTSFADIDGSDNVDALTDGLMMLRYLFGLRGASLIDGAVATGASRQSAADVEAYIISLMP
jgi:hypothetical protein